MDGARTSRDRQLSIKGEQSRVFGFGQRQMCSVVRGQPESGLQVDRDQKQGPVDLEGRTARR